MSPRSILTLASCSIAAVTIGVAAVAGTAVGAPHLPAQPPAAVPAQPAVVVPAHPGPVLHLPTTLHLVVTAGAGTKIDSSHVLLNEAITKPGQTKLYGIAAVSCSGVNSAEVTCTGAMVFHDGALLISETIDSGSPQFSGKVIGGSGSYAGARGNISGRGLGGGRSTNTVTYTLG